MKKLFKFIMILSFVAGCTATKDFTHYVNPFIGTLHEGHCHPCATVPMGMVQVGPDSTNEDYEGYGMDHCSGYQISDSLISGFSQTRLNGTGCPSLGDILLMPYCKRDITDFNSRYAYASEKEAEFAEPGYYKVRLTSNHADVELTATEHSAFHHYTFEDGNTAKVIVDLQHGLFWAMDRVHTNVTESVHEIGNNFISGHRVATEWASRDLYYHIEFDTDFSAQVLPCPEGTDEKAPRILCVFPEGTDEVYVQIGLSTTSSEAARQNMVSELSGKTFEEIRYAAKQEWNGILSRLEAKGDEEIKTVLYTALYHLYLQPNNIADVDGMYRTAEGDVRRAEGGKFLTTLSLWDTYRAAHPMYTLITPSLVPEFCSSIMDHYRTRPIAEDPDSDQNRYLPRWALWGKETNTMIGNHAVPVLVDAYLKGLYPDSAPIDELYEAVRTSLTKSHYRNHIKLINQYGYIPYDVKVCSIDDGRETVSRLLEGAYDFHCGALLAESLGKADSSYFRTRSKDYVNVYDQATGFFRGRNAAGMFKAPYHPARVVGEWVPESDYTEGNSYHYQFHVQHDVPALIELMGGKTAFAENLDSMFYNHGKKPFVSDLVWNIFGTIGQYWHGNEPCHHVPYLYKFTDEGYKTDALIHFIVKNFSRNIPEGLKGNDDCGQMSAWYMFSVMGFYPVDPCNAGFVLGAPQLPYMKFNLENGRTFEIFAENLSDKNIFVEKVLLNGQNLIGNTISYDEIMKGGKLEFFMKSRDDYDELMGFDVVY